MGGWVGRRGSGKTAIAGGMTNQRSMAHYIPGIGMPLEIVKGFDGKEHPVHHGDQRVEQVFMYSS